MERVDLLEIGYVFKHKLNVTHILAILANSFAWVTS